MKKSLVKLLSGIALATAGAYAVAAPISVVDKMELNLAVTNAAARTFEIDLTDDLTAYTPGANSVTSAILHLLLSDTAGNEKYSIFLGSNTVAAVSGQNLVNGGTQMFDITLDQTALADLSSDGKLTVTLKAALQGKDDNGADYLAVRSLLEANPVAVIEPTSVPEPASLGLMGIALAGIAAVRRRKQK